MSFKVDIKRIVSILLVSLFIVSISNVVVSAALSDLSDNEEVTLEVLKEGEDTVSAANDCINDNGTIKVEDGKTMLYMTLTDNGSETLKGYLNNLYYYKNADDYNNDIKSNVNIISTNDLGYPEEISIELTSDEKTVYIGFAIVIPSMPSFAMEHKARLIYNNGILEEDKDTEEDKDHVSNVVDLKDGTYSISVSFIKTNSEDVSMGNSCLDENAKLVVDGGVGKVYLTLKTMNFNSTEAWITNLWFYNNDKDYADGTKNVVEVISTNDKNCPEVVAFELSLKSDKIYLTAETSDNYHSSSDFRLKLDYTSVMEEKYEDGLYEVEIGLLNASKDEASMASSAINEKALINIKDGKAEVYISTKPLTMGTITASLQTLQYEEADGTYTYAKVTTKSSDGSPTGFKFTLPSYNEILNVKVNPMVAMMGNRDIQARLNIDYSTMILASDAVLPGEDMEDEKEEEIIEDVKEDKTEISNETTDGNIVNTPVTSTGTSESIKTGDSSNVIVLVSISILSLGITLAAKKKVKRSI